MDDIWIISWFNHTAFDANPIWKPPTGEVWRGVDMTNSGHLVTFSLF